MFRIRRVFDDVHPRNRYALEQVQGILASRFSGINPEKISRIPEVLRNPLKYDFRSIIYLAEGQKRKVKGFALISHDPDLRFCYLDFLATSEIVTGRGIGDALYERVREEAALLNTIGVFFECLPDDPLLCRDPEILKQNKARLKFYEKFGARVIKNTAYETPVKPGTDNAPFLVFDDLGSALPLRRDHARKIAKSILIRKYKDICNPEYINIVVESFKDDPVLLREPRYHSSAQQAPHPLAVQKGTIALVVSDRHTIHHVKSRGYVESPVRIRSILSSLEKVPLFTRIAVTEFSEKHILSVHDADYVRYFKRVCENMEPDTSVYPYVFPIRNQTRPPIELSVRAGYYCIDTFTPLNKNAYLAAKRAVDCTLSAAIKILEGARVAYALVRPPGHHAERHAFGGFCYFNSSAIAAQYLSDYGTVAILDLDYHHGNGQQNIFYKRNDVLTVSIHGHPRFAYPYFSGFAEEQGEGDGIGFNINYPLPENVDGESYLSTLKSALSAIKKFDPKFLVVCLGLDTAKGDPTGTWSLKQKDFMENGKRIGDLQLPTVVIQEGGYNNRSIGGNARAFFEGMYNARFPNGAPNALHSNQKQTTVAKKKNGLD